MLRTHEDELNHVLRETVPGLVQGALEVAVQTMLSHLGTDDRMLGAEHHRLLIRSDAFHVSVLFQPTLTFLDRVSAILPSGLASVRASTEVLDDFVLQVYLPQLEEKTSMLFHNIVTGHDAFLVDSASLKLSPEPLLKVTISLLNRAVSIFMLFLGLYPIDGPGQLTMCHAEIYSFPPRELLQANIECHHSILSTL